MRPIQILEKTDVEDIIVNSHCPSNLNAYEWHLLVDDSRKELTLVNINLNKNSRSVGFQDDFKYLNSHRNMLSYLVLDARSRAGFLKEHYEKFRLNRCTLRIQYSKTNIVEYPVSVSIRGTSVEFNILP